MIHNSVNILKPTLRVNLMTRNYIPIKLIKIYNINVVCLFKLGQMSLSLGMCKQDMYHILSNFWGSRT